MINPSNHDYIIGIDPGQTTGLCIYHKPGKKVVEVKSGTCLEMIFYLKEHYRIEIMRDQVFIRIEDARKRKWIPQQKTESAERGRREGAGYVKAHCGIWEDFCTINGISFELVAPKNNKTKVSADYFRKLSGWEGKTNGHQRDAGMLVIGY